MKKDEYVIQIKADTKEVKEKFKNVSLQVKNQTKDYTKYFQEITKRIGRWNNDMYQSQRRLAEAINEKTKQLRNKNKLEEIKMNNLLEKQKLKSEDVLEKRKIARQKIEIQAEKNKIKSEDLYKKRQLADLKFNRQIEKDKIKSEDLYKKRQLAELKFNRQIEKDKQREIEKRNKQEEKLHKQRIKRLKDIGHYTLRLGRQAFNIGAGAFSYLSYRAVDRVNALETASAGLGLSRSQLLNITNIAKSKGISDKTILGALTTLQGMKQRYLVSGEGISTNASQLLGGLNINQSTEGILKEILEKSKNNKFAYSILGELGLSPELLKLTADDISSFGKEANVSEIELISFNEALNMGRQKIEEFINATIKFYGSHKEEIATIIQAGSIIASSVVKTAKVMGGITEAIGKHVATQNDQTFFPEAVDMESLQQRERNLKYLQTKSGINANFLDFVPKGILNEAITNYMYAEGLDARNKKEARRRNNSVIMNINNVNVEANNPQEFTNELSRKTQQGLLNEYNQFTIPEY